MRSKAAMLSKLVNARKSAGISQQTVADRMQTSQENVSRLERAADMKVSTLVRYAQAIEADLSITVIVGDESLRIESLAAIVS